MQTHFECYQSIPKGLVKCHVQQLKSDHTYRSTGSVAFLVMTSSVYLSRAALPPNPRKVAT